MRSLLAVDLGLRTGLAMYGDDSRLLRYRSQHFGTAASLRRAIRGMLDGTLKRRARRIYFTHSRRP